MKYKKIMIALAATAALSAAGCGSSSKDKYREICLSLKQHQG